MTSTTSDSPDKPLAARRDPLADYRPEDFFFLRSPLLPWEDLARLLESEAAGGDLTAAARLLAGRPEVAEALFVASPELVAGLERNDGKPDPKKAERLRQTLTRYLLRLTTRPTPFGLFAGGSLGRLGERTELQLAGIGAYRRHTRLDMDFLDRLARDLENDPALRRELTYRPNNSLYRAAGKHRYAEGRLEGAGALGEARAYHLVALGSDLFLEAALAAAENGASLEAIARAVAAADPETEIESEVAEAFVGELIDTQVLVSDLGPRVTGDEPIHGLIARLAATASAGPVAGCLAEVRDELAALDARPLGSPAELYRGLARKLEQLGSKVDLPRLFQVDMTKPVESLSLGPRVIEEVKRAIGFLYLLRSPGPADAFSGFREDFLRRYEPGRLVPLTLLLDEESGIGFQRSGAIGSENSPLLRGIAFPGRPAEAQVRWSRVQDLVVRKTFEAARGGAQEVAFTDADLEPLSAAGGGGGQSLYSAFQAIFSLAGASAEAVDRGDFKLLFKGVSGASGATLLGRFCHGDPELTARLREHLRREERHDPDAVFAEIVHLPEGRIGNILLRPLLREYEIPFLGQGGAAAENQLPIGDLLVTVMGDQVRLYSQRLGKRVIPRLGSAHNYSMRGLGIYRFLCALQHHGTCGGLSFPWGPLDQLPFLPRIVYGKTIFSAARWRVEKDELAAFADNGLPALDRIEKWRLGRQIPRRVLLADGDNELFVDFGSRLAVEAFLAIVKNRPVFTLLEQLQESEGLVLAGPEGRFTHEIVLPFVRRAELAPLAATAAAPLSRQEAPSWLPGSRWVYAKLYTGTATADGILEATVGELTRRFGKEIDSFFFLRYSDPDFHLRLRFEVGDEGFRRELRRQLEEIAAGLRDAGGIWDLRFDSYRPEVDRYGGPEGLRLCEKIFHADSEAALALLPCFKGDAGAELRWQAALCSVDGLVRSLFGEDLAARAACLEGMARGFAEEFRFDKHSRLSINNRMRGEKKTLDAIFEGAAAAGSGLALVLQQMDARRRSLEGTMAELRRLDAGGRLATPIFPLAASLAHMTVNRLVAAEARPQEAVIYETLHRQLLSRQARQPRPAKQLAEVG